MTDDQTSLDRLRTQIDEIDDQIHDLLMQRTLIVREVAAAKALSAGANDSVPHGIQALAMRPDREAEVTRRLVDRHKGELPVLVIVRLWRELMTAKTRLQAPLSVLVYSGGDPMGYWDLARFYFGSPTPLEAVSSAREILQLVAKYTNSIGIVPDPAVSGDDWWCDMAAGGSGNPSVVAKIPFVFGGDDKIDLPSAYVVAPIKATATGDDTALIAVRIKDDNQAIDTVTRTLKGSIVAKRDLGGGRIALLVESALIDIDSNNLPAGLDAGAEVSLLGLFANPIDLDNRGDRS